METASEVVAKKNIGRFAVEARVAEGTSLVLRRLAGEGGVDTKALIGNGSFSCGVGARRTFLQFCRKADGASVKDWGGVFETGNTVDVFVCIV